MHNPDFRDLFSALSAAEARFLVVGAYAAMLHIPPRYTKDLDIWVDATPENAVRVNAALRAFGAPLADLFTLARISGRAFSAQSSATLSPASARAG
jgi:hypothetical protein